MTILQLSSCILVTLLLLSLTTFKTVVGSFPCKQVGCGCRFTNGSYTYEITMKDIRKPGDNAFKVVATGGRSTYYISPCHEFSQNQSCQDVTMCQTGKDGTFPVAKYDIEGFSDFLDRSKPIAVKYRPIETHAGVSRQLVINLKCGPEVKLPSSVSVYPGSKPIKYTLDIIAPGACPQNVTSSAGSLSSGLSTGGVLVAMFFVCGKN